MAIDPIQRTNDALDAASSQHSQNVAHRQFIQEQQPPTALVSRFDGNRAQLAINGGAVSGMPITNGAIALGSPIILNPANQSINALQHRPQPIETQHTITIRQASFVGVLYRVREENKLVFYVGGFTPAPIKIQEFNFFEPEQSFSTSASISVGDPTIVSTYFVQINRLQFFIKEFTISATFAGDTGVGLGTRISIFPQGNTFGISPVFFQLDTLESDSKSYEADQEAIAAITVTSTNPRNTSTERNLNTITSITHTSQASGTTSAQLKIVHFTSVSAYMTGGADGNFYVTLRKQALDSADFEIFQYRLSTSGTLTSLDESDPNDWKAYITASGKPYGEGATEAPPTAAIGFFASSAPNGVRSYDWISGDEAWFMNSIRSSLYGAGEVEIVVDRATFSGDSASITGQSEPFTAFRFPAEGIDVDDYAAIISA